MPSILKIRVVEARDLPIMDRSSGLTDAYVEILLENYQYRTSVCKKTLDPKVRYKIKLKLVSQLIMEDSGTKSFEQSLQMTLPYKVVQ